LRETKFGQKKRFYVVKRSEAKECEARTERNVIRVDDGRK
jgi:hypothetical protein